MKLRLIAESHADRISREQSAKNLVVTSLIKVRNMLGPMGLTKRPIQKHRVVEPIGDPGVFRAFNSLREVVRARAQRDARSILNGENAERIGEFWGFQVPTGWYDVHAGQMGRPTATGAFDNMIRNTVEQAAGLENDEAGLATKAELLNQLASQI